LKPTAKEVQLIQSMSVGQQNNPLWSDVRQWQVNSIKQFWQSIHEVSMSPVWDPMCKLSTSSPTVALIAAHFCGNFLFFGVEAAG